MFEKLFLICSFLFPPLFSADFDQLSGSFSDLGYVHHVNVISGTLHLPVEDWKIASEVPLNFSATYSSDGPLQCTRSNFDLKLKELRGGFLIQGGWNLFAYTQMLVYKSPYGSLSAYVTDQSGGTVIFDRHHGVFKQYVQLKANPTDCQLSGENSARRQIGNAVLFIDPSEGTAVLKLPNGGKRTYFRTIHRCKDADFEFSNVFYRLVEEVLPSGHIVDFFYDQYTRLTRIETKSPNRKVIFSTLNISINKSAPPMSLTLKGSDGSIFEIRGLEHNQRDYISSIKPNTSSTHQFVYAPGRKGTGMFLKQVIKEGEPVMEIDYYQPLPQDEEPISKGKKEKGLFVDKVKKILMPDSEGKLIEACSFNYGVNWTEVKDSFGKVTCYEHDGSRLQRIIYRDQDGSISSQILILWKEHLLIAKLLLDHDSRAIFSKTFRYDSFGNVIEESLWGNLTGYREQTFDFTSCGELIDADRHAVEYQYSPEHLLIREKESGGLETVYRYQSNTDLLVAKFTLDHGKMIRRQFFRYDKMHLLVEESLDDGNCEKEQEKAGCTFFTSTVYLRSEVDGKIVEKIRCVRDFESGALKVIERTKQTYGPFHKVVKEEKYGANDQYILTNHYQYDQRGLLTDRFDSLNRKWRYRYDSKRRVIEAKESGHPAEYFSYDSVGRVIRKEQAGKPYHEYSYDLMGNLIQDRDEYGRIKDQIFNCFNQLVGVLMPHLHDENGQTYRPTVAYAYDVQGNIARATDELGHQVMTLFNTYRQPVEVIQKDGSITFYRYNTLGQLIKVIYPDGSDVNYEYDALGRVVRERGNMPDGECVYQELWDYNTFFLLSHTNRRGQQICYEYNHLGQKIVERIGNLERRFSYDALNHCIKEEDDLKGHYFTFDSAGKKVNSWFRDSEKGVFESTSYLFDEEERLVAVKKTTSAGLAEDHFFYDEAFRLALHQDPLGHLTKISYGYEKIGEVVYEYKITTDPLQKSLLEKFNNLGQVTLAISTDSSQKKVLERHHDYDRLGRLVRSVHRDPLNGKENFVEISYDVMGRKILEKNHDQIKQFSYDLRGELKRVTTPSGKQLFYAFDPFGRLVEIQSLDRSIDYQYSYTQFDLPCEMKDRVTGQMILREYDDRGNLVEEKDLFSRVFAYAYDLNNRLAAMIFPDASKIEYRYQGSFITEIDRVNRKGEKICHHEMSHYNLSRLCDAEKMMGKAGKRYRVYDMMDRVVSQFSMTSFHETVYDACGQIQSELSPLGNKNYQYDALGQIQSDGNHEYAFDGFSNPCSALVDEKNQLLSDQGIAYVYDLDGNVIEKRSAEGTTWFSYDAMNRLMAIKTENELIRLTYDPLSRLVSITSGDKTIYPIYFDADDIGTIKEGKVDELKIEALFPDSDKRELLYIEKEGKIYLPHIDANGTIEAVDDLNGSLKVQYDMGAFGEGARGQEGVGPYRFMGKRLIGAYYFFGARFYDPDAKRWLTQDPMGFVEGINLYAFVRNNPTNRIDQFGFLSEEVNIYNISILVPKKLILDIGSTSGTLYGSGMVGGAKVDWVLSCGFWREMKFSPEELSGEFVDISPHIKDLMPRLGNSIGLITLMNGMNTSLEEFRQTQESIAEQIPEGTLMIGLYNPTRGVAGDIRRVIKECIGIAETQRVAAMRQFMEAMAELISAESAQAMWQHIVHSEGGMITAQAIESMNPERKKILAQRLNILSLGSLKPLPKKFGYSVENIYSDGDFATGLVGRFFSLLPGYNVTYWPVMSSMSERSAYVCDHAIMGKTYQVAVLWSLSRQRIKHSFYTPSQAANF